MRFASSMFDRYRSSLAQIDDFARLSKWLDDIGLEAQFLKYAAEVDKLSPKAGEWEDTRNYMMPQIRALVGRYSKLDDEAFYRFYLPVDDVIQKAITSDQNLF